VMARPGRARGCYRLGAQSRAKTIDIEKPLPYASAVS
jgi:hypothetical protein